jgi:4-amino-4-deoxy-L-arabinose transferase-like glycosyltransferase
VKRERRVSVLLLTIGLGFALLGQYYFTYRREYVRDGVLFWAIAIYSLGLLLWWTTRRAGGGHPRRLHMRTPELGLHTLAALGGAGLSVLAGELARQPGTSDFTGILWLWLIGVAWFLLAFVRGSSLASTRAPLLVVRLARWLRDHWRDAAGLAALLSLALVVRAVDLEHIPANLGGDEGTQGVAAIELLGPPLGNPFATGWFSVPTMSFLAYGIALRVFGETVAGLRALSALVGTVTVLTTFLLARELWGRRVAWMMGIALACCHYHIHFSRLGSNQIFDGLFMTLALWLFVRALRSKSRLLFALTGVVTGLGWYTYFGARLVGIILAVYLAWRVIVEYRFVARYGRLLLISLCAALVVLAPLLVYYVDRPADLVSRSRQVSIFASGWLEREQQITGRSAMSLLLEQFWKAISAFNYTLDPTFWYHSSVPLLDFVGGGLFVLGLVWAMAHCRGPANGLLLIWFWLALGLGWVLTENPPSSQRMTVIAPALAVLIGLGLDWLMVLGRNILGPVATTVRGPEWRPWNYVAGWVLVMVAVFNLRYYFWDYTPIRIYGNPTAEVATEFSRYLSRQDGDSIVYFYGPPFMYWNFGTLAYMARGVEGIDVLPQGEGETPIPDLRRGARFFFHPERLGELPAVQERFPGGENRSAYSSADGRLLYVLYEVE